MSPGLGFKVLPVLNDSEARARRFWALTGGRRSSIITARSKRRSGGIGRRAGFKIPSWQQGEGPSPSSGSPDRKAADRSIGTVKMGREQSTRPSLPWFPRCRTGNGPRRLVLGPDRNSPCGVKVGERRPAERMHERRRDQFITSVSIGEMPARNLCVERVKKNVLPWPRIDSTQIFPS